MRHRVKGKKLNRDGDHRKALVRNMSTALVENDEITTTLTKAKFIKPIVEKLVTKARTGGINAVKAVRIGLSTEDSVRKLMNEIAPKYAGRPGGYTRIVKLAKNRAGDNTPMAKLQWVKVEAPKAKKVEKKENEDAKAE